MKLGNKIVKTPRDLVRDLTFDSSYRLIDVKLWRSTNATLRTRIIDSVWAPLRNISRNGIR